MRTGVRTRYPRTVSRVPKPRPESERGGPGTLGQVFAARFEEVGDRLGVELLHASDQRGLVHERDVESQRGGGESPHPGGPSPSMKRGASRTRARACRASSGKPTATAAAPSARKWTRISEDGARASDAGMRGDPVRDGVEDVGEDERQEEGGRGGSRRCAAPRDRPARWPR